MRALLIEDDPLLAQELAEMLANQCIHIDTVNCGKDGLELTYLYEYNAIILDLGLPDMSGQDVITALRKKQNNVPVLVLSGCSEVEARLAALHCGADDFLLKPFDSQELVARLHALIRRANGHCANIMKFGSLVFDLQAHDARIGKQRIPLTTKEYQILELLCLKRGGVVSKENLLNHLYGGMDEPEIKIIDVFICKLRKKIHHAGTSEPVIETVWGRGYRLCNEQAA